MVDRYEDLKTLRAGNIPSYRSSLFESFRVSVELYKERDCLGRRLLKDVGNGEEELVGTIFYSYEEVFERVERIASALHNLGLRQGDFVGITSPSRPEWLMTDLACHRQGIVLVPVYESVPLEEVLHVCKVSELKALFIHQKRFNMTSAIASSVPSIQHIIGFDDTSSEKYFWKEKENCRISNLVEIQKSNDNPNPGEDQNNGVFTHLLSEIEHLACESQPVFPANVSPDDLATIIFTSGTMGAPKGAMITHHNLQAGAAGLLCMLPDLPHPEFQDVVLSYLPLAHVFQRACEHALLSIGACLAYYSGDIATLLDDVGLFKPTMFLGVPRVYEKIYNAAVKNIQSLSVLKTLLFKPSFKRKLRRLRSGRSTPLLDKLLFKKGLAAKFGGRLRAAFSGSAALNPEMQTTLEALMCCPIGSGYACSETSSAGCVERLGDGDKNGNVGYPLGSVEMKLLDAPELGYTTKDEPYARGEVLFSGPPVFQGYYKDEEKTRDAFVEIDGRKWYRTGDIGMLDHKQRLVLIDRKSTIIKAPHGEFIKLTPLTEMYTRAAYVEHVLLVGGCSKLVAIVSVLPEHLPEKNDPDQWLEMEKLVKEEFKQIAQENKLRAFEQVGALYISREGFSLDNNLLTPSQKIKRGAVLNKYNDIIQDLQRGLSGYEVQLPICCAVEKGE
ncbi:hypothetical protein P9112_010623 [Eukaryota sp. TZLM1-RC]